MASQLAAFDSESAYDALRDGLPQVVRLMERPHSFEELVAAEPELDSAVLLKRLKRLVQTGIVKLEGDRYSAVAHGVQSYRQEGMVTFLSKYMLPHFTRLAHEPANGFFVQLDLVLPPEDQRGLLGGPVRSLLDELVAAGEETADEMEGGIVLVVGTSDVPPAGEAADRMLETVRRCAKQRATPGDADRAVLAHADGTYTARNLARVKSAVEKLADALQVNKADGRKANYTLILGFSVRERTAGVVR